VRTGIEWNHARGLGLDDPGLDYSASGVSMAVRACVPTRVITGPWTLRGEVIRLVLHSSRRWW
jgi:hypothetical protein